MVEATNVPRQRKIQAWYICALLHYQGKVNNKDTWAVGLLRRHVDVDGLKNRWEFVEGLDYEAAQDLMENVKPRLVRASASDLKEVMHGIQDG